MIKRVECWSLGYFEGFVVLLGHVFAFEAEILGVAISDVISHGELSGV